MHNTSFFLQIRVEAYDQGIPPLSSDLDINIYVRNVNDYEPQFIVDEIVVNFTGKKNTKTASVGYMIYEKYLSFS